MGRILVLLAFGLLTGGLFSAAAQSTQECFSADWLQGTHTITLTIDGGKLSGVYAIDDDGSAKTEYAFTAVRRGARLTVKFADNKLPDISPSEMKSTVWTLTGTGKNARLKIKVYGKNYQTHKYQLSFAEYRPCKA